MGMSRLGLLRRESLNRQDEAGGCRVGTKTELRGRGTSARSQARVVMQARVRTKMVQRRFRAVWSWS